MFFNAAKHPNPPARCVPSSMEDLNGSGLCLQNVSHVVSLSVIRKAYFPYSQVELCLKSSQRQLL